VHHSSASHFGGSPVHMQMHVHGGGGMGGHSGGGGDHHH